MISLTKLNGDPFVLNADLIEQIEATPDSVITLTTGQKLMVLEDPREITSRVVQFRRGIHVSGPHLVPMNRVAKPVFEER